MVGMRRLSFPIRYHWIKPIALLLGLSLVVAGMNGCRRKEVPATPTYALKGINIAHALEAPKEGDWGVIIDETFFDIIQKAGFNLVRIPVKFSSHAGLLAPYPFDKTFLQRIDEVVGQALDRGLTVILVMQNYDELYQDPDEHEARFISMWEQIAEHYAEESERCYFELLNEPHDNLTNEIWNTFASKAVAAVRKTNPTRKIILGGIDYNSPKQLEKLVLPQGDGNIIATIHYYKPYEFTHQGSSADTMEHLGRLWTGTKEELDTVRKDFDRAQAWAKAQNVDLFLGEFGTFEAVEDMPRINWTKCIREEAEKRNIGWAYWDFCANFGIYDLKERVFDEGLLRALMPS